MDRSLSLVEQINGSPQARILKEFVTNSAIYPLFDAIRAVSNDGVTSYLLEVPHYLLLLAAFVQAWVLGRPSLTWQQRAVGNLIAPALYTVTDIFLEGVNSFFSQPYHWLYWLFSLLMALIYAWEGLQPDWQLVTAFLKNVGRVLLFPALYALSELSTELTTISWQSLLSYWQGSSGHIFILLAALLLGMLLGIREAQTEQYLTLLRALSRRLRQVSEWSLSPELLAQTVQDSQALAQHRVERAILFADIRGFTAWSEDKEPEVVVNMLNEFYEWAEKIITSHEGMKPHFIGDEVITWFTDATQAVDTAVLLRDTLQAKLRPFGLSVGVGLHFGPVVEGLLGSASTRSYDIIGDVVNTTSRVMAAAEPGELLVSDTLARLVPHQFTPARTRQIQAKGKRDLLTVYCL
jgi:adenylate cyclase